MSCNPRFLACDRCKDILQVICCERNSDYTCCGQTLKELVPNTSDGAAEKHMPAVEKDGNRIAVKVGSVYHPMSDEHRIDWVYLETKKGGQRIQLMANEDPAAEFVVSQGDSAVAVYAFCNLHGFWKTDIS